MAVPTTNIKFDDIWYEANGSNLVTTNNITTVDLFGYDYFRGPNGSNLISFNAWGANNSADQIFGVTNNSYNWGNFSGLIYWYDNTVYDMTYRVNNLLPTPTPPTPPDENDFQIKIEIFDSTNTYRFADSGPINSIAGSVVGTNQFSLSGLGGTPLLLYNYWNIQIQSAPTYPGGGTVDIAVQGTVLGSSPVNNGANQYNYAGFGGPAEVGLGYSGVSFDLTIY